MGRVLFVSWHAAGTAPRRLGRRRRWALRARDKLGQASHRAKRARGNGSPKTSPPPQETAINIGYACSLITDEMTQFQVGGRRAGAQLGRGWGAAGARLERG